MVLKEGKPWKQTAQMCLAQESSQRFEQHEGRTNSGYGCDLRNPKIERLNNTGRALSVQLQYLWKEKGVSPATAGFNMHAADMGMQSVRCRFFMCASALTRSLVSIWARFLWMILTMPGGWIQASPSTCTGTPSSPRMVIFTWRHWEAAEQKTAAVRCGGLSAFYQLTP